MSQVSHYRDPPYQGVSQAPPQVRLDEQAQALENVIVTIPQGAAKRPPFEWLGRLAGHPGVTNGCFTVLEEREGVGPQIFTVTVSGDTTTLGIWPLGEFPRPYEPAGVASASIAITAAAQAYLDYGSPIPNRDIEIVTIEDTTFLLNRKVTVDIQRDGGGNPIVNTARPFEALLWVREAAYGIRYAVTVSPVGGSPVTVNIMMPDGAVAGDSAWADTSVIANRLVNSTTWAGSGSASGQLSDLYSQGFTVLLLGSVIYIAHPTTDFTVNSSDGRAGLALTTIKGTVNAFSDLPKRAYDGFVARLTQSTSTTADDAYLGFFGGVGTSEGYWKETLGPGAQMGIDPKTMPVGLVYDGGWKVDVLPWKSRTVGDEVIAPDPDFVGRTLEDLNFWRGRLALLSTEEVALSSGRDPYRYYPDTVTTAEDDDPLFYLSPFSDRVAFTRMLPFGEKLIAFGDRGQAQVTSNGALTAATGKIDVLTTYEFAGLVRPIGSNGKVYLLAPHGKTASTVYELRTNTITNVTDGEDMTGAIPRYLPANINWVANCPVNYMAVYGQAQSPSLYLHLFRYADQQRVQNAWMRWKLPTNYVLAGMVFRNTTLYALVSDNSQTHLLALDTAPGLLDPNAAATIRTYTDCRATTDQIQRSYSSVTNLTTFILPYPILGGAVVRAAVTAPGGHGGDYFPDGSLPIAPEGLNLGAPHTKTGSTVTYYGNWMGVNLLVGLEYLSQIELTTFYALGQDKRPLRTGRLNVRKVIADLSETGYLRAKVYSGGRPASTYEFTGYILDNPTSSFDKAPLLTKPFVFAAMAHNEQLRVVLETESHLGFNLAGLEWVGELNPKAQRT